MRYRAKVTVVTGGREYGAGSVLPGDISPGLLNFLRERKFLEPLDLPPAVDGAWDGGEADEDSGGFGMAEPEVLKSPEEISRLRSKKDVCRYAASIGLDLGEDYEARSLRDLQAEVVNFQEEQAVEEREV